MKKKARELQRRGKEELESMLAELKKDLMKLNAQLSMGTIPKSPGMMKQTKKQIARITMLIEKLINKNKEGVKEE